MYTYIYIYIYIYRILLNKSVLYTVAIYTTVFRRKARPSICTFFQLYTAKRKKETEKQREEREEGPFRKDPTIFSLPILPPAEYIHLKDVQRRRFAVRKPRTVSNTVLRR